MTGLFNPAWLAATFTFQIRNKSASFRPQTINRSGSRDIERAVVFVSPGKIRWLFRHNDGAQMTALRIPYPDTLWSGYKNVALLINLDAIWHTFMWTSRFFTEDPSIGKTSIRPNVVHADISLLAIVHVKSLTVRRESQAIRLRQIFR